MKPNENKKNQKAQSHKKYKGNKGDIYALVLALR